MKIESDIKSDEKGEQGEKTPSGQFSQKDLETMLSTVIKAKEIQSDSGLVKILKEYARSKSDHISRLFLEPTEELKAEDKKPKGIEKVKDKAQSRLNLLADEEDED